MAVDLKVVVHYSMLADNFVVFAVAAVVVVMMASVALGLVEELVEVRQLEPVVVVTNRLMWRYQHYLLAVELVVV